MAKIAVLAIIIILIAIAAFFFLRPAEEAFPSYYVSLSEAWKSADYPVDVFHEDPDALLELSSGQLEIIKGNLQSKKDEFQEESQKAVVDVYLAYLDLAIEVKKLDDLYAQVSVVDDACENITVFSSFSQEIPIASQKLQVFAVKANEFAQNYPEETEKIFLYPVGNSFEKRITELEGIKKEFDVALGVCA